MSFWLSIHKPRRSTFNQYTICEDQFGDNGEIIKSKLVCYANSNDEAKSLVDNYIKFHFIDGIVFANGKEKKL